jgi:RHS repeat-associated protein
LTDETGNLVESYDYKVFGETRIFDNSGTDITVASNGLGNQGNPYMYHGRRKEENGLYFFRARYLDTALGRFLQKDPIGDFGDGVSLGNGQSFCLNNPVIMIDPFGRDPNDFRSAPYVLGGDDGKSVSKNPECMPSRGSSMRPFGGGMFINPGTDVSLTAGATTTTAITLSIYLPIMVAEFTATAFYCVPVATSAVVAVAKAAAVKGTSYVAIAGAVIKRFGTRIKDLVVATGRAVPNVLNRTLWNIEFYWGSFRQYWRGLRSDKTFRSLSFCDKLRYEISEIALQAKYFDQIKNLGWRERWEVLKNNPDWWLTNPHNIIKNYKVLLELRSGAMGKIASQGTPAVRDPGCVTTAITSAGMTFFGLYKGIKFVKGYFERLEPSTTPRYPPPLAEKERNPIERNTPR